MLDSNALKQALLTIYGVDSKYIVPLDEGWYVPLYDKSETVGTWIGYRILEVKPNVRTGYTGSGYIKSVKIRFRLSFVGKQAEELALQTLLFDDRIDVVKAFEQSQTQLNYVSRTISTYPVKEGGLNDSLCWFTDIDCQSFYDATTKYGEWGITPQPQPDPTWIKNQGSVQLGASELRIHR